MRVVKSVRQGLILSIAASFFGALVTINLRYLLKTGENPLNLATWQILCMLPLWLVLLKRQSHEIKRLSRKTVLLLLFIGIAGSIGVNYMMTLALAHTTAVNFSFLYRTVVVFTIFFAWLLLKESLSWKKGILVLFILAGSYLVTADGHMYILSWGDIYTFVMAASAALITNVMMKHAVTKFHPEFVGAANGVIACTSLFILAMIQGVFQVPHNLWLVFIGSGIYFAMVVFRNRAYKVATASFVTMVFALTPFFVVILASTFLHEHVTLMQFIGGLIIVGATILAERHNL